MNIQAGQTRFWDHHDGAAYQDYRFDRIRSHRHRLQELCCKCLVLLHRKVSLRIMEVALGSKVPGKQQICMHIASYLV